ncbi:LysR family transcriptional regulator [Pseudovibrio japonicus]|uniref:LysR family transcriptional regulator n=1 Tax=Pseudovibrio japonicus TaxID=366534 RepID=A0ABQ3EC72_9HYPH|nr:LysR family transcriptional regulator [Pseudovibrio japonicus]GHB32891.1 LysR family transcriptional regulator [Pseudovibrio japonicus]
MGQLEDFRMFALIVEQESISKAADHMGIAKSAVSRRLSLLEDQLGTALIQRTTRQWQITEAGRLLYERTQQVMVDVDDIFADLSAQKHDEHGQIRISIPMQFGLSYLSPVLLKFSDEYPNINLTVDFTDRLVDLIEENYDLAIRISQLKDSSLISRKLADVTHLFYASPDYLKSAPPLNTAEDLKNHKLIQYGPLKRFKWNFIGPKNKEFSVSLSSHMNTNNSEFMLAAAAAGKGVARLPSFFASDYISSGKLVTVLNDLKQEPFGMHALYPGSKHLPRRVRVLLDFLSEHCQLKHRKEVGDTA